MKHIHLATPGSALYNEACIFANSLYQEKLRTTTNTPSKIMLVATEKRNIVGCIGLNPSVTSDLFLTDLRYQRFVRQLPRNTIIGEQNIFAVRDYPAGVPLLIAGIAAYGKVIGVQHIAYAGVNVSCKTVDKLGFTVQTLGNTLHPHCAAAQKEKYQCWLHDFQPVSCVLSTCNTADIFAQAIARYGRHTVIDAELQQLIHTADKQPRTVRYA